MPRRQEFVNFASKRARAGNNANHPPDAFESVISAPRATCSAWGRARGGVVFWPHPSLPRISSVAVKTAERWTEDEGPALVLVGWWRANARRGDDADDRDGARPAVSSVDVVAAGGAVPVVFEDGGRDRGTSSSETLGPPSAGSPVPPSAARSADSARPRRAPKPGFGRKPKSRRVDDDAPLAPGVPCASWRGSTIHGIRNEDQMRSNSPKSPSARRRERRRLPFVDCRRADAHMRARRRRRLENQKSKIASHTAPRCSVRHAEPPRSRWV